MKKSIANQKFEVAVQKILSVFEMDGKSDFVKIESGPVRSCDGFISYYDPQWVTAVQFPLISMFPHEEVTEISPSAWDKVNPVISAFLKRLHSELMEVYYADSTADERADSGFYETEICFKFRLGKSIFENNPIHLDLFVEVDGQTVYEELTVQLKGDFTRRRGAMLDTFLSDVMENLIL